MTAEQPTEPLEFGARITVTRPDGTRERWLRITGGPYAVRPWTQDDPWLTARWSDDDGYELTERGAISLGWDEPGSGDACTCYYPGEHVAVGLDTIRATVESDPACPLHGVEA